MTVRAQLLGLAALTALAGCVVTPLPDDRPRPVPQPAPAPIADPMTQPDRFFGDGRDPELIRGSGGCGILGVARSTDIVERCMLEGTRATAEQRAALSSAIAELTLAVEADFFEPSRLPRHYQRFAGAASQVLSREQMRIVDRNIQAVLRNI